MTKTELNANWESVLDLMRKKYDGAVVGTYFTPLKPIKLTERDQKLYLLPPRESSYAFYKNGVINHQEDLLDCIDQVFGKPYIAYVVEKEYEDNSEDPYASEDTLNPKYTFESFVDGPNNRLAYAAAHAVAEGYSRNYNPLFIYGGSGLGKTHLLHAIGHYVSQKRKNKKFIYVSAETFTSELIDAIRNKTQQAFKEKYRKVDYLLFDDVQFIAKNKPVEDELFNTFNALYSSNKQLVFTSDRPPSELNGIPDRLVTRLNGGLSEPIYQPEYLTRVAILKNKAAIEGLDINDPDLIAVIEVIAKGVENNIRELESSFSRVLFHSTISGEPINLNMARQIITEVFDSNKENEINPADIKKAVANYYKIKVSEMESPKRSRNIAYPRQIAIYMIREMCPNYSLPKIGELFGGRDHTSILYSYEKISIEIKESEELQNTVNSIKSTLSF